MNWKENLAMLEQRDDWKGAVNLMHVVLIKYPNDVDAYIRHIYLLNDIMLEHDPELYGMTIDSVAKDLKEWFDYSYAIFKDNAEYLFFVGYIISIAEWYFPEFTKAKSLEMIKKAMEIDVNNILYRWGYELLESPNNSFVYWADIILHHDHHIVEWLKTKGFPGQYILDAVRWSYNNYK